MATIFNDGLEASTAWTSVAGTPAFAANQVFSGTNSMEINAASEHVNKTGLNVAAAYARVYLYLTASPSITIRTIRLASAAFTTASLRLTTSRTLQAWDDSGAAQVGSTSAALATATWHYIELGWNNTTNIIKGRLNGSEFATGTLDPGGNITDMNVGHVITGAPGITLYYDAFASDDAAFPGAAAISQAVGLVNETETPQGPQAQRNYPISFVSEADSLLGLVLPKFIDVGTVTEVGLPVGLVSPWYVPIGFVGEQDDLMALPQPKYEGIGVLDELEELLEQGAGKSLEVATVEEASEQSELVGSKGTMIGTIEETGLLSPILQPIQDTPWRVREYPRLEHHALITPPGGIGKRFARDEPDPAHKLLSPTYSDTIPGGFESWDARLQRRGGIDYPDLKQLSHVEHFDAAGDKVWEGRLHGSPASSDAAASSIAPRANGWQSHLEDNKHVRCLPVDASMSNWVGMNNARKLQLWQNQNVPEDGSLDWDVSAPALVLTFATADSGSPFSEMWFYAPGIGIGRIWYRSAPMKPGITSDSNYNAKVGVSLTPEPSVLGTDYEATADLAGSSSSSGYFIPTLDGDFAWVQFSWNQTMKTENLSEQFKFTDLRVYGPHGLTLRGSDPKGVYASDVIAMAVANWAPMLDVVATPTDDFVIPHLPFRDATTVAEIVKQSLRFHANSFDWAVWDDRTLHIYRRGEVGRRWRARSGPSGLNSTGQTLERLWNGIIVQYTGGDGIARTVGPPGSGADVESAILLDTDPENPANQLYDDAANVLKRWDMLVMGGSTSGGAIQVGSEFLAASRELDQSGEATFTGYVEDENGIVRPYSHVRSGDLVSFSDVRDTSWRRISGSRKDDDARTCSVSLDAPPEGLQALLERLDVVLVPLGQ